MNRSDFTFHVRVESTSTFGSERVEDIRDQIDRAARILINKLDGTHTITVELSHSKPFTDEIK